MTITKFLLTNLNCTACGKVSQMKIGKIPDVASVQIDQNGNVAEGEITAPREISIDEIQQALAGTDYKVQTV